MKRSFFNNKKLVGVYFFDFLVTHGCFLSHLTQLTRNDKIDNIMFCLISLQILRRLQLQIIKRS